MTPIFFYHIIAINIFQISQDKKDLENALQNKFVAFFCHFLPFFDTFSATYSHSGIKFEFSEQFQSIKRFI